MPESPFNPLSTSSPPARHAPKVGIGLCMSGGGYRAMLFHLGTLWRLNELGLLPRIDRYSSVSGGSITNGLLGLRWSRLEFDAATGVAAAFEQEIVRPLMELANISIFDRRSALTTVISTLEDIIDPHLVAHAYDEHLFHGATLRDLPGTAENDFMPRFIFNATNLMTGVLWRYSKKFMADWRIGVINTPTTPLAVAVAASSAFPIGLPPVRQKIDPLAVTNPSADDVMAPADLCIAPYNQQAVLVDGGVYDNMGLETVWKELTTVLISHASGAFPPDPHPLFGGRDIFRVFGIIDNQVAALRKRQVIGAYKLDPANPEHRDGAYWSTASEFSSYGSPPPLVCPPTRTAELAQVATVLQRLPYHIPERLVNWGYAICDAAIRKHCVPVMERLNLPINPPQKFPHNDIGV